MRPKAKRLEKVYVFSLKHKPSHHQRTKREFRLWNHIIELEEIEKKT